MTAADIIDTFGGTSALAGLLDLKASTVHSWRIANSIPEWRQARVLELALELQKPIAATDFPHKSERISRKLVMLEPEAFLTAPVTPSGAQGGRKLPLRPPAFSEE